METSIAFIVLGLVVLIGAYGLGFNMGRDRSRHEDFKTFADALVAKRRAETQPFQQPKIHAVMGNGEKFDVSLDESAPDSNTIPEEHLR